MGLKQDIGNLTANGDDGNLPTAILEVQLNTFVIRDSDGDAFVHGMLVARNKTPWTIHDLGIDIEFQAGSIKAGSTYESTSILGPGEERIWTLKNIMLETNGYDSFHCRWDCGGVTDQKNKAVKNPEIEFKILETPRSTGGDSMSAWEIIKRTFKWIGIGLLVIVALRIASALFCSNSEKKAEKKTEKVSKKKKPKSEED